MRRTSGSLAGVKAILEYLCLSSLLIGSFDTTALAQATVRASRRATATPVAFVGIVQHVVDGDTIDVTRPSGEVIRVRLEGIDCPERGQSFGKTAATFTRQLVLQRTVAVVVRTHDRYGRFVARVSVGGQDVSVGLLQAGMAWHFL